MTRPGRMADARWYCRLCHKRAQPGTVPCRRRCGFRKP